MSLPSDNPVLDARALSFPADGSVLRQVTLAVGEGETVAVLGPAGSGKSVLLGCLTGRLTPGGGSVWANGKAFHLFSAEQRRAFQRRSFGLVPQRIGFVPELTLLQNTALPLVFAGIERARATARAQVWLDRFELGELGGRRIGALPEDALRRAALARGMVTDPLILFADEPLAGLAEAEVATIARMLLSIARSHGTAVLCFTREAEMADRFQRRIGIDEGRTLNRPVPPAPVQAARAPEQAPLQPAVAPRMVTLSMPGGGLASTAAHGVGPVVPPSGSDARADAHPAAARAGTMASAGSAAPANPMAPMAPMSLTTNQGGPVAGVPVAAAGASGAEFSAALPAGSPSVHTTVADLHRGPFRPPIPPPDPRLRGGLPLGTPSHPASRSGQVRP